MDIPSNQTCFVQTGFGITTHIPRVKYAPSVACAQHNELSPFAMRKASFRSTSRVLSFPFVPFTRVWPLLHQLPCFSFTKRVLQKTVLHCNH
jgi:hypothetical protein